MVDIALLGCGGGMPAPQRFLSSLLINYKGRKILIDCGEGTQVSMKMLGWGFKSIDMICITHLHGDHVFGLFGLLSTVGNSGRTEPITIIGPEGIMDFMKALRIVLPYVPFDINVIEASKERLKIKVQKDGMNVMKSQNGFSEIEISAIELEHSIECLGYSFYFDRRPKFDVDAAEKNNIPKRFWSRLQKNETIIDEGKIYLPGMVLSEKRRGIKLSFITDTRPKPEISDFIYGSDLFVCEGTYGDDDDIKKAVENKHMTFRESAELALNGNVKELLLTHFSPSMMKPEEYINNAKEVFKNTVVGFDRLVKILSFDD